MPLPFAIVGPGRLGVALARRWRDSGMYFLGFHGRDPARVVAALHHLGGGASLAPVDLSRASVVALTVTDAALGSVARSLAAAGAVRRGSLWLHTSGVQGLLPLAPLAGAGARIGALHPLAPVPDPALGASALTGRPALVEGPAESVQLLRTLAERAGLVPVVADGPVDRPLYHAACALAANGTTALLGVATDLIARAMSVEPARAASLVADLAASAAGLVAAHGPELALTGPIVRGDDAVVSSHLEALAAGPRPDGVPTYRAVMIQALRLARARGLDPEAARRIEVVLDGDSIV